MTDRRSLAGDPSAAKIPLLEKIELAAKAGVDWLQIREKDLSGRELELLAGEAVKRAAGAAVLINDRLDVALTSEAAGVHLGEQSLSVEQTKRLVAARWAGRNFLIGVSVHSPQAAQAAEAGGADYVIFGPVFATPSKDKFGTPQGLVKLRKVCERVRIPILAIGGISAQNASECVKAGAVGIAAIRLFQDARDLASVVARLREKMG